MSTVHPARSSGSLAVFVPAIVAIALLPAPNADAQQVRLGGGGGSPVTVEFLQDITMTMKPGADPRFFFAQLGIALPGVLADTTLGVEYNLTPSPPLFVEYQFSPDDPIGTGDGPYAAMGNESSSSSSTLLLFWNDDTFSAFGEFKPGGWFTFKASEWVWSIAGTESPWVSPGTVTLGPENFYFYAEPVPVFLSSADWDITASDPSPVPEIDPAGLGSVVALVTGALGVCEHLRRRRRTA